MDLLGTKFGRGPKELCGAIDLINGFKLWPIHDFFCKRSFPLSISETRYLRNVVGDTEIRKGEGMELDQLLHNTPYLREKDAPIHPFGLDILREAFQLRESALVYAHSAEKEIPSAATKSMCEPEGTTRKQRNKKNWDKDDKEHKHRHIEKITGNEPKRNGHLVAGSENIQNSVEKKRRHNGSEDPSYNPRHQKIQKMHKLKVAG